MGEEVGVGDVAVVVAVAGAVAVLAAAAVVVAVAVVELADKFTGTTVKRKELALEERESTCNASWNSSSEEMMTRSPSSSVYSKWKEMCK